MPKFYLRRHFSAWVYHHEDMDLLPSYWLDLLYEPYKVRVSSIVWNLKRMVELLIYSLYVST